mgnify:CR=1 FL=1
MSFSINCLEITASKEIVEQNSNIYKNLLTAREFSEPGFKFPKRFFFNDYYKREPDEQGNLVPNEQEKRFNSDIFLLICNIGSLRNPTNLFVFISFLSKSFISLEIPSG